jgi:hypothetical protein
VMRLFTPSSGVSTFPSRRPGTYFLKVTVSEMRAVREAQSCTINGICSEMSLLHDVHEGRHPVLWPGPGHPLQTRVGAGCARDP